MTILFKTFPVGHLVSDREYERLHNGLAKVGVKLIRDESEGEFDIVMVKGFSHTWADVEKYKKPVVMYSIGTEWKEGIDIPLANEPIRELYQNANAVVHISDYCRKITEAVFGPRSNTYIIIPGAEPNLPPIRSSDGKIKCVSTAIWRPIKRLPELKRVMKSLAKTLPVTLDIYGTPEGPMIDDFKIYHDYDIYLQVSRKEGMPNTVLEALAHGLPCLVTNHGGAKEAVGTAGVVIENDPGDDVKPDLNNIEKIDYKKFKAGMTELVKNLDHYRSEVRKRVSVQLNDKTAAYKFLEVFQSLL